MSNLKNKTRRVSLTQLEILWEFLSNHKDIASAHNRSLQDKAYSCKKWSAVTATLNAVGDGAYKDWRGWSKYWVDFKAKLKKRAAVSRGSQTQSGEGSSKEPPLTDFEAKFLNILGEKCKGLSVPDIQGEPFVKLSGSPTSSFVEVKVENCTASGSHLLPLNDCVMPESEGSDISAVPPADETLVQSPSIPSTPSPNHNPHPLPPSPIAAESIEDRQSTWYQRRRRFRPMSQEAARRALVHSAQMRAEAAVRNATALEKIARNMEGIFESLQRIERRIQNW